MKKNKHIGIYGICQQGEKILFVKKSRGPYTGLFDLPGGGIEFGEDLETALCREFQEEIGGDIEIKKHIGNTDYSSVWENDGVPTKTHHIALYYEVSLHSQKIKTDADGHDSEGAVWLNINEIVQENTSPIAYKILKGLFGFSTPRVAAGTA